MLKTLLIMRQLLFFYPNSGDTRAPAAHAMTAFAAYNGQRLKIAGCFC